MSLPSIEPQVKPTTVGRGSRPAAEGTLARTLYITLGSLALGTVYYYAGRFGLAHAFLNPSASAIWPPAGIALAAVLLWGGKLWPGVLAGAFLVNIKTQGSFGTSL